jgi:hypothetical protein
VNSRLLAAPGGPLPPALTFVQFAGLDQLFVPSQINVPGAAETLFTTSEPTLVLDELALLALTARE